MGLTDFIKQAPRRDLIIMGVLAILAGLANALLVVSVNEVTKVIAKGARPPIIAWGGFILAFLIFYLGNRLALLRANRVIERLLKRLRMRVMNRLRCAELTTVDGVGRGTLYTLIAEETNHLSVAFPMMVDTMQQGILLAASLLYLAYLSPAALFGFLTVTLVGYVGFRYVDNDLRRVMNFIQRRQAHILDATGDIIHGAKELRLNRKKSDDVFLQFRKISRSTEKLLVASGDNWASLLLLSAFVTYLALGVFAFLFPGQVPGFRSVVFQIVPVTLFCMGALTKVVSQAPMFVRADVGLRALMDIERKLERGGGIAPVEARELAGRYHDFESVSYVDLRYSYRDAQGEPTFSAGPLDLTVHRGELVFIVGGNGSGKSTALHMMTGLLPADGGRILVDGAPVVGRFIAGFREIFSAIFVDFHLFDRLYGLENVDPEHVNRLIEEMGLGGKVVYENGRFSRLSLSTGQRKRLALIVALLEDRPFYIFDEWSAEQDAHFREYFYTRVLPELRERGKAIVAVTHDERYWHVADRVIGMDLGRVQWERPGNELGPA